MPETLLASESKPLVQSDYTVSEPILLEEMSPRDKTWHERRSESDLIGKLYLRSSLSLIGAKIMGCSKRLEFIWGFDKNEQPRLKLQTTWFCRQRHCSMCQWRWSLVWRAKAFQILPQVVTAYPNHRFIFLTLTWKNCDVSELKDNLKLANKAWMRLTKRKQFPAAGFIKSVEVTRAYDCYFKGEFLGRHGTRWINDWEFKYKAKLDKQGTLEVHPHFHCLLMVKPGYFGGNYYVNQQEWTDLWQQSMQVDYKPIVDIRTVKVNPNAEGSKELKMLTAILEVLKYSVKPSDLVGGFNDSTEVKEVDRDFLVTLTKQLHGTRSVATGGILKKYLSELEDEPIDMIHGADQDVNVEDNQQDPLYFNWNAEIKKYILDEDYEED